MTVREEAHRLLDAVPEDRLTDAVDMLRQWASPEPGEVPRRRFRTTAIFDGEHDLGARAKQIVRDAWSGGEAGTGVVAARLRRLPWFRAPDRVSSAHCVRKGAS